MLEDALQVVLVDCVEDRRAAALLDNPQRRLGGVLDGRIEAAPLGHVAEALAVERVVPLAARQLHVLRIAAAALLANEARRLVAQLVPRRGSLQALEDRLTPALQRPGRHQRGL